MASEPLSVNEVARMFFPDTLNEIERIKREAVEEFYAPALAYLHTLVITSDNIGEIRRSLLMPFDCHWNGWVRDTTAALEMRAPRPYLVDAIRLALEARFSVGPGRAEDEGFSEVVIDEIMTCLEPFVRGLLAR